MARIVREKRNAAAVEKRTRDGLIAHNRPFAGPARYRRLVISARERRRMVREIALLVVLAFSYLHYYYWEVQLEIAKLNEVRTFIPTKDVKRRT